MLEHEEDIGDIYGYEKLSIDIFFNIFTFDFFIKCDALPLSKVTYSEKEIVEKIINGFEEYSYELVINEQRFITNLLKTDEINEQNKNKEDYDVILNC